MFDIGGLGWRQIRDYGRMGIPGAGLLFKSIPGAGLLFTQLSMSDFRYIR